MRILAAILPLILSCCVGQHVTVRTPDGTKIRANNFGDFGNIASSDRSGSSGGLSSAITGDVQTSRETGFNETAPGEIRAITPNGTTVVIGGVVNNSTPIARHWDGITSSIRNWVTRLIAGDLFDVINTRTTEGEKTSRRVSDNEARVRSQEIDTTGRVRRAEIRAE